MIGFVLIFAALCGATFHFAFRKSLDGGGRASVFLMLQCFFATVLMVVLNVEGKTFFKVDGATLGMGIFEGCLYVLMMSFLGKAFQSGPPGLTVATLNSASIVPALLMALLFGAQLGHGYTLYNGVGSLLVICGLFWASRNNTSFVNRKAWVIPVTLAFLAHSIYLTLFQWRTLLLTQEELPYLSFSLEHPDWFQPLIFLTAGLLQLVLYMRADGSALKRREILWSALGGMGNGGCTFGLIWATEIAGEGGQAMLFPIAGVLSIFLCSLWGRWLYRERVNWKASALCFGGLLLGSI